MRKIIPYLKSATPQPGYQLQVEFEDGVKGIIDLKNWLSKEAFKYWLDEENFRNFEITADRKLEWNKDIDMDPDAFYLQLIGKTFDEYTSNKQLLRDTY